MARWKRGEADVEGLVAAGDLPPLRAYSISSGCSDSALSGLGEGRHRTVLHLQGSPSCGRQSIGAAGDDAAYASRSSVATVSNPPV